MNSNRIQLLLLQQSLSQLWLLQSSSAVHYRFPHFYSSRTERNFEKPISDVIQVKL
jgi:hypothetical protein